MALDLEKLTNDLNNLEPSDIKKIGSAPWVVKIVLIVIVCILVAVAGYFISTTPQLETLAQVEAEEDSLKSKLDKKQAKAVNLNAYKQQLEEMEQSFGALLRQLPNKTEIETLLTDISQTGISAGLEINFFEPKGLSPKEFYAEFPIKITVTGRYHEFAEFISGVAALPRIVTLRNIYIKKDKGVKLVMDLTAVTYQYLDESTAKSKKGKKGKKGKKRKKK